MSHGARLPRLGTMTFVLFASTSRRTVFDLRERLKATRWPDRELVADQSQGVRLATIQQLVRYWQAEYDWRKVEARLNNLPQFITEIDGFDIHFIHVRSRHENALPLIVTHGWPGSDHRAAEDRRSADQSDGSWRERIGGVQRRDSLVARIRLFGQADRDRLGSRSHRAGMDRADEAPRIQAIRRAGRRLGQCRHGADGADAPPGLLGIHTNMPATVPDDIAKALQPGGSPPSGLSATNSTPMTNWTTSTSTASVTRSRWRTVRRLSTALWIHLRVWRHGCWITTSAVSS